MTDLPPSEGPAVDNNLPPTMNQRELNRKIEEQRIRDEEAMENSRKRIMEASEKRRQSTGSGNQERPEFRKSGSNFARQNAEDYKKTPRVPGRFAKILLKPKQGIDRLTREAKLAAHSPVNIGYNPKTGKRVTTTPYQLGSNFVNTLGKFGEKAVANPKTLYRNQAIRYGKHGERYVVTTEKRLVGGPLNSRIQTIVSDAEINPDGTTTPFGAPVITESMPKSNLRGISYNPQLGSLPLPQPEQEEPLIQSGTRTSVNPASFNVRPVRRGLRIASFRSPLNPNRGMVTQTQQNIPMLDEVGQPSSTPPAPQMNNTGTNSLFNLTLNNQQRQNVFGASLSGSERLSYLRNGIGTPRLSPPPRINQNSRPESLPMLTPLMRQTFQTPAGARRPAPRMVSMPNRTTHNIKPIKLLKVKPVKIKTKVKMSGLR